MPEKMALVAAPLEKESHERLVWKKHPEKGPWGGEKILQILLWNLCGCGARRLNRQWVTNENGRLRCGQKCREAQELAMVSPEVSTAADAEEAAQGI